MAHAQKPDFVFRRNGQVHLNRRGASVQSTNGSGGLRISGSNAGYTMFRGSVKGTGYPFHSPVSPPVRHRVPSRFNWTLPTYRKTMVSITQCDHREPLQNTRLLKQGEDVRWLGGHTSSCMHFFVARLLDSSQNCENRPSATSCLRPSVRPSWNNSAPIRRMFMNSDIQVFF